jgi:endonuclease/exonuclease/phosphatase family metal-dependent hydrolase
MSFTKYLLLFSVLVLSRNSFAYKRIISVMTYNVENLFDTLHDDGKEDYTFLPLIRKERDPKIRAHCYKISNPKYRNECFTLDWSAPVLLNKIRNLSKVIKNADRGRSPDILILQEVENINALQKLKNLGLADENYKELILVEGPDKRGIDVAILSKFPLAKDIKYHEINLSEAFPSRSKDDVKKTRGILEATFSVRGKMLSIFANHWPSQANPNKTRFLAANALMKAIKDYPNPYIVAGDFNTEYNDRQNAIEEILTNKYNGPLVDFEQEYLLSDFSITSGHRGTHFYRGKWNSLDKIFFPKKFLSVNGSCEAKVCIRPYWSSYKVVKEPEMLEEISYEQNGEIKYENVPQRFDPETGLGVSDHLPVVGRFTL